MNLSSLSFMDGEPIPDRYAFAKNLSPQSLIPGDNMNPQLTLMDVPDDAQSPVSLCADLDAPEDLSLADTQGVSLDGNVPRRPFFHWVLIDLPPARATSKKALMPSVCTAAARASCQTRYRREKGSTTLRIGLPTIPRWPATSRTAPEAHEVSSVVPVAASMATTFLLSACMAKGLVMSSVLGPSSCLAATALSA